MKLAVFGATGRIGRPGCQDGVSIGSSADLRTFDMLGM
jgi:hypothetical protein